MELAKQSVNGQACKVEELALASGTSANFLVQILIDLKSDEINFAQLLEATGPEKEMYYI